MSGPPLAYPRQVSSTCINYYNCHLPTSPVTIMSSQLLQQTIHLITLATQMFLRLKIMTTLLQPYKLVQLRRLQTDDKCLYILCCNPQTQKYTQAQCNVFESQVSDVVCLCFQHTRPTATGATPVYQLQQAYFKYNSLD